MSGGGFDSGFSRDLGGIGFNQGFSKRRSQGVGSLATAGALFSNFDTYLINGIRELHGGTAGAGYPAYAGMISRSNITITSVLKVTSTVSVKGFKFVRTPEASSSWLTITGDDMDVVLSVKAGGGGTMNAGAISTKTFATNSKVRSATRTTPFTVNSLRSEFDIYTVYDASAVTLTAGTYTIVYRSTSTQIGLASFWKANVPIPTTTSIYPDPADAANGTYYPVIEILDTAP